MIILGKYRIYRAGEDPKTGKPYDSKIPTDAQIVAADGRPMVIVDREDLWETHS